MGLKIHTIDHLQAKGELDGALPFHLRIANGLWSVVIGDGARGPYRDEGRLDSPKPVPGTAEVRSMIYLALARYRDRNRQGFAAA